MDNSLKIITVAIGAVIACLVASIALFVFNVSTRGTSTPSYAVEEMNDSTNGEELSALVSNDTSGVYLLSSMKKLNSKFMFKVKTKDSMNVDTYRTYDVGASLADTANKSSAAWINPNATFKCTLLKDTSTGEVIGLEAKQTSQYSAVSAPIQDSADFPGIMDLYKYAQGLDTLRESFNDHKQESMRFISIKPEFEALYNAYANTTLEYYKYVKDKSLDADQLNDYLLLRLLVRDGNYFKLSTIAKYTNLVEKEGGSYKLIPSDATLDTGYLYLLDVDSSLVAKRYEVEDGKQSSLSCTTADWPLDTYATVLEKLAVFFSTTEANNTLSIVDELQDNLMAGLNILSNLDKQNARYEYNLDQALAYFDKAKLLTISLNSKIQELNTYLTETKSGSGRIMPLPTVLQDLIDTTNGLYDSTFELGGAHYAQSRTVSASSLKNLYNGVKPFYDDYKAVVTELNDSHLGAYVASSLSLINKLIDVSAATGGASTDHDATDALDKMIQTVRSAR